MRGSLTHGTELQEQLEEVPSGQVSRHRKDEWFPRTGRGRGLQLVDKGCRASLWGEENVPQLTVVIIHKFLKILKITELPTLHGCLVLRTVSQ